MAGGISWKKYANIDEALTQARKILGVNYYMEQAAKEYIQKFKRAKNKKSSTLSHGENIKEEESSKRLTYKECLVKGVDPLDGSYIDWKLAKKFEEISPQWKKEIEEEILTELRMEMKNKFELMKKEYDERYDFPLSDDDMDIAGQGQKPE